MGRRGEGGGEGGEDQEQFCTYLTMGWLELKQILFTEINSLAISISSSIRVYVKACN